MRHVCFAVAVVTLIACSDNGIEPRAVAAIVITSPIGNRLAVGRNTQLTAEALDAAGATMPNVTVSWSSSASTTATVSQTGHVSGVNAGMVNISAAASGVTGTFALQVKAADLDGIVATVNDPFAESLVGGLTTPVRSRVEAALAQCESGADAGNFTTIEACLTTVRAEVAAATDATDRALLASLSLYLDHIQVLMHL